MRNRAFLAYAFVTLLLGTLVTITAPLQAGSRYPLVVAQIVPTLPPPPTAPTMPPTPGAPTLPPPPAAPTMPPASSAPTTPAP